VHGLCRGRQLQENRWLQRRQWLRARRSDARHDLYLVDEVLLLVVDRLEGSGHRGRLFDHGAQHVVHLLCGDGHGDENRGGKGGTRTTMASIVGGSGYQAVMVLDWGGHNWGNWKIARHKLRPTASKR
jgi:hypothetical protein